MMEDYNDIKLYIRELMLDGIDDERIIRLAEDKCHYSMARDAIRILIAQVKQNEDEQAKQITETEND